MLVTDGTDKQGSSPRMRGTLFTALTAPYAAGIIPAYAGNTIPAPWYVRCCRDHPRVCGEHHITSIMVHLSWGSSPRMRGTPHHINHGATQLGIIPAYAGNTNYSIRGIFYTRDHPRVCGEHRPGAARKAYAVGSSPRMRGTPCSCGLRPRLRGIIPAYAGNTVPMCGLARIIAGSSPRMRGTPSNTRLRARPHRDHPRVCGEHHTPSEALVLLAGSSPRMRGTRHVDHRAAHGLGIIPAYAGNTQTVMSMPDCIGDHPRVCGEHLRCVRLMMICLGSSPRMRGTLQPS